MIPTTQPSVDVAAGVMLVFCGGAALLLAPSAEGRQVALEPGFFPTVVASLLCGLGLLLGGLALLKGATQQGQPEPQRLRPFLVIAAVAAFGMLVRLVGLTVATCALVLLSSLASPEFRPKEVAAVALTLSIAGVLIFSVLLGLPLTW